MQDQYSNTLPSQSKFHTFEPSMTPTNVSFMPGQDAFSSTPATVRTTGIHKMALDENADESSWNVSLDPPMVGESQFSDSQQASAVKDATIRERSRTEQGLSACIDESATISTRREITFQPHNEKRNVVDLTNPSAMIFQRFRRDKPMSLYRTPAQETDDDSFDGLPPGMSPPVMMSPARPPRSMAELSLLKLSQTPGRDASTRIARDLVRDVQYRSGNAIRSSFLHSRVESTMSTVLTPPSLSRYRQCDTSDSIIIDSSLESMMQRVGLHVPQSVRNTGSTPGLRLRSHVPLKASEPILNDSDTSPPPVVHEETGTSVHQPDDLDMESDSDSMYEINDTAHPSHPFLMASVGARDDSDDSFESNHSRDFLDDGGAGPDLAPIHPFSGNIGDDGFDDSFDDEMFDRLHGEVQEETLFGVLPQQRMQALHRSNAGQDLRMAGGDFQDILGIGSQIGHIEESPTPAPRH